MGAQKNRLIETVLLSTHNICFGWEIRTLFFRYTLLTKGCTCIWIHLSCLCMNRILVRTLGTYWIKHALSITNKQTPNNAKNLLMCQIKRCRLVFGTIFWLKADQKVVEKVAICSTVTWQSNILAARQNKSHMVIPIIHWNGNCNEKKTPLIPLCSLLSPGPTCQEGLSYYVPSGSEITACIKSINL